MSVCVCECVYECVVYVCECVFMCLPVCVRANMYESVCVFVSECVCEGEVC